MRVQRRGHEHQVVLDLREQTKAMRVRLLVQAGEARGPGPIQASCLIVETFKVHRDRNKDLVTNYLSACFRLLLPSILIGIDRRGYETGPPENFQKTC